MMFFKVNKKQWRNDCESKNMLSNTTNFFALCGIGHHLTYASEWGDEDTPISFKVEMLPWKE